MHRLTSEELITLRNTLTKANEIELLKVFEYGCGVEILTCEEESQRLINELDVDEEA